MLKLRTRLRALFIIILLIWASPTLMSLLIGSVFVIVGQLIHFISAGYLVKQEKLITAGPYRYVRNPFYVSSFLVDVGLCIITQNIHIAIIYLPVFYLIVIPRRVRKEEKFLKTQFGERYIEYCQLVRRFIPHLSPASLPQTNGCFDWNLILKYREQWRLLRTIGLVMFFYLRAITLEYIGQIVIYGEIHRAFDILSEPFNLVLLGLLSGILIIPPLWEYVIKRK
ncbi:MAG: isoprenylcysteine carboxylmethyltransferase family protein [Planctomycetota bacterium]|nr:isoprenylcysteine carboxylmethyltransferase family protein [Planctomycetota bacterium]MDI6787522.1 isoprenylcysteine carboxylmethyltransferase family protein [Planctomycetota bacterium]